MQTQRISFDKTVPVNPLVPRGTETVLVVASEKAEREYAAWTLRELGYNVIEAVDGQEAICLFYSNPDRRIDLVIADAAMPRMCGKHLAHKMATLLPKSRILITSYYPAELAIHNYLLDAEPQLHAEAGQSNITRGQSPRSSRQCPAGRTPVYPCGRREFGRGRIVTGAISSRRSHPLSLERCRSAVSRNRIGALPSYAE